MAHFTESVPWWFKTIVILLMLPLLAYPAMLAAMPDEQSLIWLMKFYPFYVVASGICAWMVYRHNPMAAWILIGLLILSHLSMFYLTFGNVL